jgi:hypothetical protein
MVIDAEQHERIDWAMLNDNPNLTLERPMSFWSDVERRFLRKHNARWGEVVTTYNPYTYRKEIIFDTEEDAVMFCLKVL